MDKKSLYIINGPNLNLLGKRQVEIYGSVSFEDFLTKLKTRFHNQAEISYFQSNHEGALIDKIQEIGYKVDGIIFNAGGYTHTSIALGDTIASITSPVIEVHISDIYKRESFRHISYIKAHAKLQLVGHGLDGYEMAIEQLLKL